MTAKTRPPSSRCPLLAAVALTAALLLPAAAHAQVETSGTIINQWGARVRLDVEDSGDTSKVQIVLRAANNITWWKSLDISRWGFPVLVNVGRLETKDANRESSIDLSASDGGFLLKLDFWKGGFLGVGAWVGARLVNVPDNLGKRLIYTWERD
jgi:hypothetical protein